MRVLPLLLLSLLLLPPPPGWAGPAASLSEPDYRLSVSLDPSAHSIRGEARIRVRAGEERVFTTGRLRILTVTLNRKEIPLPSHPGEITLRPEETGTLTLSYAGTFAGGASDPAGNPGVAGDMIAPEGISLTGIWYPQPAGLTTYALTAVLPQGFTALSEADTMERRERGPMTEWSFAFPYPVDGIHLVASDRYEITQGRAGGVTLYAYFFPEDRKLAALYLRYARRYLERYASLLTPYPYRRFSIVENILPTGYSMPTYTLLGRDVVRLPFIVETSLGHEILHQWFGNLVYADLSRGNWAEGLTTYLADHRYEEEKQQGWAYRKRQLIDYGNYVQASDEIPLRDFRFRTNFASRAIGYGKASMVFHMLKKRAGEEIFLAALRDLIRERRHREASWEDIREVFEARMETDLSGFFTQWIDGTGLPEVRIENPRVRWRGEDYGITLDLVQKGGPYTLDLPVRILSARGPVREQLIRLDREKQTLDLSWDREPSRVVIDGDYDTPRRLSPAETPPVISALLGDPAPRIVPPPRDAAIYEGIVETLKARGALEKEPADLSEEDRHARTLVLLGADNPLYRELYGESGDAGEGCSLRVRRNPWNPRGVTVLIHASSRAEADAAFPKVFHYGRYSRLVFRGGKNIRKQTDVSERGLQVTFQDFAPRVVNPSGSPSLATVIDRAASRRIVYVGERHDQVAHHRVQVEILRALYAGNPKIAVGMEMFQIPFQQALDDYIEGKIEEREFLRRSEYFDRWRFDYHLYKPILDFARRHRIPVVALNTPREITRKISRQGLSSLTQEEREQIPRDLDFSDEAYRERLRKIFQRHGAAGPSDFEHFYQAQVVWDETMAHSIDRYLREHPGTRMLVIAGSGHLIYGSGIPKRTFRRNGYDFTVVVNDLDPETEIADYILYPDPMEGEEAPRLMVLLEEEEGRIRVSGFPKESVSREGGLRRGDTILAVDGEEVRNVADVKLALFYKRQGEPVRLTVLRRRALLGPREVILEFPL